MTYFKLDMFKSLLIIVVAVDSCHIVVVVFTER